MEKTMKSITSHSLPKDTVLSDNYIIEDVIGEGGFSITYKCRKTDSNKIYAVKEYFPDASAYRTPDSNKISSYKGKQEAFEKGRRHFLKEAGILSKFSTLEHLVSIHDIIEENDTVYIVMDFIDGITLKQYVEENEPLSIEELSALIIPVMSDISKIHTSGLLHRDITPENLIIGTDNKLYLIDFGSAAFEDIGETENKTVILKPGFAPPEQYLPSGKLGAWTDVYGLCATMYYALTGITPADALLRQSADNISHISDNIDADKWRADVIMKGLSLHPADRYQSMDALYQAFIIPPVEMSTERKAQLDKIKHSKTIMPSGSYTNITNPSANKPLFDSDNSVKLKRKLFQSIVILIIVILAYAGFSFFGTPLPLWPNDFTYAALNDSETKNSTTPVMEKDSDKETGKSDTVKKTTNENNNTNSHTTETTSTSATNSGTTEAAASDAVTGSNNSETALNNNTTTKTTTDNNTSSNNNSSTTTKNAGDTTSGKKNSKKTTEEEDIFISMPDDEYDTFTD